MVTRGEGKLRLVQFYDGELLYWVMTDIEYMVFKYRQDKTREFAKTFKDYLYPTMPQSHSANAHYYQQLGSKEPQALQSQEHLEGV